ncbi:hypothetical protein J595_01120 [Acinetobacter sp. 1592897]|nr:hypothetical protein J594_3383 [Acinetobacter sp. 259052]EYT19601.1 hypothetical protein J595_01120 [Acinetobacter sp. 1592897]
MNYNLISVKASKHLIIIQIQHPFRLFQPPLKHGFRFLS